MIIIDRKTFSSYGWSVVVVLVVIVMTLLASPFAMYIRTAIRTLHFSVSDEAGKELNAFAAESYVMPTDYTAEEIEQLPNVFAIGKNDPVNVVARFDSNFTECVITKNTTNGDGLIMDFNNSNTATQSPLYKYRNSLTKVSFEYGVENISTGLINGCSKVNDLSVHSSVYLFADSCLPAWNWATKNLTLYYNHNVDYTKIKNQIKTLVILDETKEIPEREFYETENANRWKFKTVILPASVTKINAHAFRNCPNLESIELPNTLSYIGEYAFQGDVKLTDVPLPANLSYIGDYAFHSCTGLKSIIIPNGIKTIPQGCFQSCTKLTDVTIPDSVKTIKARAFSSCQTLVSISVPQNVSELGEHVFSYCYALKDVNIPLKIDSIPKYAFYFCRSLEHLTIPDNITAVENSAFHKCSALQELVLPETCTRAHDYAFKACESLTSVYIPDGMDLAYETFAECTALESISLPNKISIGNYCFVKCPNLVNIEFRGDVLAIESTAFTGISHEGNVYANGCGAYYDESNWQDGVFSIDNVIIYCDHDVGNTYEIPDGARHIARGAFLLSRNIENLTIPRSIISITGSQASYDRWSIYPRNLKHVYVYRNTYGYQWARTAQASYAPDCTVEYLD